MIEAVGERYWPDYFAVLKRHVAPGGSALVQAIVIADDFFEDYRSRPDFIQTYIFPGGMLLSPQRLGEQCRKAGLKIAELYSFGLDYAHTLETWLGRFDAVSEQVGRLGFDERFRRMWRYYLAYCAAGFSTRAHGRFAGTLQAYIRPATTSRPKQGAAHRKASRVHPGTSGNGTAASVKIPFNRLIAYATLQLPLAMAALPVVLNVEPLLRRGR